MIIHANVGKHFKMTKKAIISIIAGFIISIIISGLVYYVLFLNTFELFGIKSTTDPERADAKIFYTTLALLVLTGTSVLSLILKNRKFTAIGVGIPILIAIGLLVKVGSVYMIKSNYYEAFNKDIWLQNTNKPARMARQLIKSKELVGMTMNQVTEKLGKSHYMESDTAMVYWTDGCYCKFILFFEKNKFKTAYIVKDD